MTPQVGDHVRIIVDPPNGMPSMGTVIVIQDVPGKHIGIELDNFADRAHSCDGLVEEKDDLTRGITVGKGWWTTEENIEAI